jgi:hypothetical protein
MTVTSGNAERIIDDILSSNDEILGISIMDLRGNIFASTSKEVFKEAFAVSRDKARYGGTLAVAALTVVNETRSIFGGAKGSYNHHP